MKVEYDSGHDLLYLWLAPPGTKAASTKTIAPGVHADFDREGTVIGLEVLDASDRIRRRATVLTPIIRIQWHRDRRPRTADRRHSPIEHSNSPSF